MSPLRILLLSPYHGKSSHAAWAEGYRAHSRHSIEIVGLTDRAWAWRMRGGSVGLWESLSPEAYESDLILATSMTDLAGLLGLLRGTQLATKPVVYYVHENQLSYPIRKEGLRDRGLAWLQFTSMLCADEIWFNSEHNRRSWFATLPEFLRDCPDPHGTEQVERLQARSKVVPVGLSLPPLKAKPAYQGGPPLLLWNQRWEWDKNPEAFIGLVTEMLRYLDFQVVMLGQYPKREPPDLTDFKGKLGSRLVHFGWCSREEYLGWLERATLTVSTARHEFFGISVLEAAAYGVPPLLPRRLAYPELLSPELFPALFYRHEGELEKKAAAALQNPSSWLAQGPELQKAAYRFAWPQVGELYDDLLERLSVEAETTRLRPLAFPS